MAEYNQAMLDRGVKYMFDSELIGGNAGSYTRDGVRYPCAGLNTYVEHATGKIVAIGNIQDVPRDIVQNSAYREITFRIAIPMMETSPFNLFIAECFGLDDVDTVAREAIGATVTEFNERWAGAQK